MQTVATVLAAILGAVGMVALLLTTAWSTKVHGRALRLEVVRQHPERAAQIDRRDRIALAAAGLLAVGVSFPMLGWWAVPFLAFFGCLGVVLWRATDWLEVSLPRWWAKRHPRGR